MSNGGGTGRDQESSPQNNRNGNSNGYGRDLHMTCFPPLGRNTQAGEQNTSVIN